MGKNFGETPLEKLTKRKLYCRDIANSVVSQMELSDDEIVFVAQCIATSFVNLKLSRDVTELTKEYLDKKKFSAAQSIPQEELDKTVLGQLE